MLENIRAKIQDFREKAQMKVEDTMERKRERDEERMQKRMADMEKKAQQARERTEKLETMRRYEEDVEKMKRLQRENRERTIRRYTEPLKKIVQPSPVVRRPPAIRAPVRRVRYQENPRTDYNYIKRPSMFAPSYDAIPQHRIGKKRTPVKWI